MSLMLKRGIEVLVGAVLLVVLLAVVPAVAEAQEGAASTQDAPSAKRSADATSVVVRAGDSLWSISSEQLGPDATPQQIAGEVERLYALNQNQIGPDPDLIFPGQKFLLPPPGRSSSAEPATGVARERGATERAQEGPTGRGAKRETSQISENPAVGSPTHKADKAHEKAHENVAEPVNLPDAPAADPVPASRPLVLNDVPPRSPVAVFLSTVRSAVAHTASALAGSFAELRASVEERKLLGWAIIALVLLVATLMARKLSTRSRVREWEEWGIHSGYPGGDSPYPQGFDPRTDTSTSVATRFESSPGMLSGEAHSTSNGANNGTNNGTNNGYPTNNGTSRVGLGGIAQARRRTILNRRVPRLGLSPRKGLATGAHAPEVRRLLVRAAPKSRPRRIPANVRANPRQQRRR